MHIIALAELLNVDARELDKALLSRDYTDDGIVPEEIAQDLLSLYKHYLGQIITPEKSNSIPIHLKSVPIIYGLFDGSALTYIGKSVSVFYRLAQHVKEKDFDGIWVIESSRKDIDIMELIYISHFQPRDNRDGKEVMQVIRKLIAKI
ncbi:MAG: hypothetical protein WC389_13020 [Lutibacter sp.]|jgi:hypothetical protein